MSIQNALFGIRIYDFKPHEKGTFNPVTLLNPSVPNARWEAEDLEFYFWVQHLKFS